jgi:hypothetical protein
VSRAETGLQSPYPVRKSQETTRIHHQHETKWEVPDQSMIWQKNFGLARNGRSSCDPINAPPRI